MSSSSGFLLENFLIPLEEILLATQNFSAETVIGDGGSGKIYKGQLSERRQNRIVAIKRLAGHGYQGRDEFSDELVMNSTIHHKNIVPFIGYCDESNEMIVVYEYAVNGSLDDYLQDPVKRRNLTWAQRLEICIGAARGLEYLHSGLGIDQRVIHRNIKSSKILLDENLEAKIYDFGLSRLRPRYTQLYTNVQGTHFYMDPTYLETGILYKESDVYSFGVVLFEILSGTLAYATTSIGDDRPSTLVNIVRRYYDAGLEKLVDPYIRDQIDVRSLDAFTEIAYQCISYDIYKRPRIAMVITNIEEALYIDNQMHASTITIQSHQYQKQENFQFPPKEIGLATGDFEFQKQESFLIPPEEISLATGDFKYKNLKGFFIPLEEISLATRDFSPETQIEVDEFGAVYKGQLSERWQNCSATFERFHPTGGFGEQDFCNKVEMLLRFSDKNIIHFIGYCDEGNEMIIVSKYAVNRSLDHHLQDPLKSSRITWMQRLKICIRIAKALKYLHSGIGEDNIVIHRDIKSANILLDDYMDAKICGFGLALLVDQKNPQVYKSVVGTQYYLDPVYNESGIVSTHSDVYSFGVVLFEMLSGMVARQERSINDDEPQTLIKLVRRHYDEGLDNINDPYIRDQINIRSLRAFKEIAYQCLSWNLNDRPTMNMIVKRIEEALEIQSPKNTSIITIRSRQSQTLLRFLIPLKEISFATRNFSPEARIQDECGLLVYKGQLSDRWQNRIAAFKLFDRTLGFGKQEFLNEVKLLSNLKHGNITAFIGYCDEENKMIIVYEYAINGSLDNHLQNPHKIRCLTWAQRLKICIGAARGLEYLHSGVEDETRIIHRDMRSANILLNEKFEAKICGFGLSLILNRNRLQLYDRVAGTQYYLDPIYNESGIVKIETDVYSFGVVLFEMLNGMLVSEERSIGNDKPQTLINLVRRYYDDGPGTLIDPLLKDHINIHSLYAFKKIAYRCISLNLKNRPTMKRVIKRIEEALNIQRHGAAFTVATPNPRLESFLIPLEEINLATKNFSPETLIGDGGFGMVYKGQLSQRRQNNIVAIKRLDPKGLQGKKEFLSELKLIYSFRHSNIIPFVGYCEEGTEMIIVSKYARNGSLDQHLHNQNRRRDLTWLQRLKICLGAAKGLDYLHSGLGKDHRVIHRDVKSGNILLDENLEAQVCDFGLSKEGPKNQLLTQVYTKAAGTNFYLDPVYHESGILSKESDVYSLGVVLFEMVSGTPAYVPTDFVDGNQQHLINLVRRYRNDGPEKLIDPFIKDQVDGRCFHTFKELAYRCISLNFKERPTMDTIIDRIEDAIDFQQNKVETDQKLKNESGRARVLDVPFHGVPEKRS